MGTVVIHEQPKSDINTTPLVDVMLVLLIIFMITAPLKLRQVDAQIPQPGPPDTERVEPISLRITDVAGMREFYLDDRATDRQGLLIAFRNEGRKERDAQATFRLEADDAVPYQQVAELLASAQSAGVAKLGFADL